MQIAFQLATTWVITLLMFFCIPHHLCATPVVDISVYISILSLCMLHMKLCKAHYRTKCDIMLDTLCRQYSPGTQAVEDHAFAHSTSLTVSAWERILQVYSRAHKYRSDQQYMRAPTLLWSATLCASGGPSEHSKSTSTPFCVRLYWRNKRMCGAGNSNRSVTLKQGWQHGPNLSAMRHAKDIHNDSLWHPGYSVKLASFDL